MKIVITWLASAGLAALLLLGGCETSSGRCNPHCGWSGGLDRSLKATKACCWEAASCAAEPKAGKRPEVVELEVCEDFFDVLPEFPARPNVAKGKPEEAPKEDCKAEEEGAVAASDSAEADSDGGAIVAPTDAGTSSETTAPAEAGASTEAGASEEAAAGSWWRWWHWALAALLATLVLLVLRRVSRRRRSERDYRDHVNRASVPTPSTPSIGRIPPIAGARQVA